MQNNFDIDKFKDAKLAVCCLTYSDAKDFFKFIHEICPEIKWRDEHELSVDNTEFQDGGYEFTIYGLEAYEYPDGLCRAKYIEDFGDEDYKIIKVKIENVEAYLVAIYDPSKIILMTSRGFNNDGNFYTEKVSSMAKRYDSIVSINGGGFDDVTLTNIPKGCVIQDSKVIWHTNNKVDLVGFNSDNRLILVKATCEEAIDMGIRDAVTFSPFLIQNGVTNKNPSAGGGFYRASRVVIAQRLDGIILFLVTEGNYRNGPLMGDVIDILVKYGAYNAANLDGGASAQLIVEGKLLNKPYNVYGRSVITAFGLKK